MKLLYSNILPLGTEDNQEMSLTDIQVLAASLSVTVPNVDIKIRGKQKTLIADEKQKTVISIWEHFCKTL